VAVLADGSLDGFRERERRRRGSLQHGLSTAAAAPAVEWH